ncbi:hypothetical protein D3C80_2105420 [compost metagenome]
MAVGAGDRLTGIGAGDAGVLAVHSLGSVMTLAAVGQTGDGLALGRRFFLCLGVGIGRRRGRRGRLGIRQLWQAQA